MKYKNFHKSFTAPQISHEKLAEGIRLYVMGLAENLLVAEPLRNTWISLTRTSYENIKGMSVWLSILIFCLTFSTLVMSTLHMGQGVALMLGFPVRQCHKRMIFRGSVKEYAKEVNIPLYRWFEDYVYKPLSANGAAPAKLGALIVASEAAMLWYAVGTGWAVAGAATAVIIAIEAALGGRLGKIPNALRRLISAAIMISIGAIVCSGSLTENHSFLEATTPNQAGLQNDFQSYLISTSAPLIIAGLLIMSGILKKPIKRTGINWYRAALPIIELVLILLCTATMIAGK
jgi:alginate O-acetyltransferase complex protein AlgI